MWTTCARGGLKFGVYYSTIGWHHPGGNKYIEGNSNPITPEQEAFNVAQLKELLGHYGLSPKSGSTWANPRRRKARTSHTPCMRCNRKR